MKHRAIIVIFLSLALFSLIVFGENGEEEKNKSGSSFLIEIYGNNEVARALCFATSRYNYHEIFFKGPSGVKIRATDKKEDNFNGEIIEFSHVDGKSFLKISMGTLFYKQKLSIPFVYRLNNATIAMLSDGSAREKEILQKVQEEISKFPGEFQQGLQEFFLFGMKNTPGILVVASFLSPFFGTKMDPYKVEAVINTNVLDIQSFQSEFNCKN